MSPVATPMAKLTPNSRIQKRAVRRQNSSPVRTQQLSMMATSTLSPSVSGTKSQ